MRRSRALDVLLGPLALAALVAAIVLWERRPAPAVAEPAAAARSPAPPVRAAEALRQARARCAEKSSEEFRRAWGSGTVSSAAWSETAQFASHYNAKIDACLYLLRIVRRQPTLQDLGPVVLFREMLFDVDEGELYGEYRGPEAGGSPGVALPDTCRVVAFYCASRREWDQLALGIMESSADVP